MSTTIGGSFAAVLRDRRGCLSIMRVSPDERGMAQPFALRAAGQLMAEGWSKDVRGRDRCPDCSLGDS
jgi:hypothetical protein